MVNEEVRNRILCAVYAYAYEYDATSLVSDGDFDKLMSSINTQIRTGNDKMDDYFDSNKFDKDSGQFIVSHPELRKIKHIYETYFKGDKNEL